MRGTTDLAILPRNARINSDVYCNILKKCYLPCASRIYHGYTRLVHDNASAHVSPRTAKQLQSWGVKLLAWPPESPDLNPIENVWGSMKKVIR
ncbi:hypothetical protein ANCDUO_08136 [Ancylostoma duodenale]|uniref:Tc1-like transposase DDE domain-containing protein n=1 Tax=Ancylostoma duodenale TaxID=51022 RepID=A0A0C2GR51_9BILA|nr:hypothetical protein ANCDUO_08136 [Ancylostoma duodenale]